jgi:predicted membrane protein
VSILAGILMGSAIGLGVGFVVGLVRRRRQLRDGAGPDAQR